MSCGKGSAKRCERDHELEWCVQLHHIPGAELVAALDRVGCRGELSDDCAGEPHHAGGFPVLLAEPLLERSRDRGKALGRDHSGDGRRTQRDRVAVADGPLIAIACGARTQAPESWTCLPREHSLDSREILGEEGEGSPLPTKRRHSGRLVIPPQDALARRNRVQEDATHPDTHL